MITTLEYKEFVKDVKKKFMNRKCIVGIMLIKSSVLENDKNNLFIVNNYVEWDELTSYGRVCNHSFPFNVYWAGYGAWLSPTEQNSNKIILPVDDNDKRIYFDRRRFGSFKKEISNYREYANIEWGENANLILIDCNYGKLDYDNSILVVLDDYKKYGMRSRDGFCEAILRECQKSNNVSDVFLKLEEMLQASSEKEGNKDKMKQIVNQKIINNYNGDTISVRGNNNLISEKSDFTNSTININNSNVNDELIQALNEMIKYFEASSRLSFEEKTECIEILNDAREGVNNDDDNKKKLAKRGRNLLWEAFEKTLDLGDKVAGAAPFFAKIVGKFFEWDLSQLF